MQMVIDCKFFGEKNKRSRCRIIHRVSYCGKNLRNWQQYLYKIIVKINLRCEHIWNFFSKNREKLLNRKAVWVVTFGLSFYFFFFCVKKEIVTLGINMSTNVSQMNICKIYFYQLHKHQTSQKLIYISIRVQRLLLFNFNNIQKIQ